METTTATATVTMTGQSGTMRFTSTETVFALDARQVAYEYALLADVIDVTIDYLDGTPAEVVKSPTTEAF